MEYRDIYDSNRLKTGRIAARSQKVAVGDYVLVVHVCLFNGAGELLIQQRQPTKKKWGNLWDVSAAGAAMAGDSSQVAAQRETLEELGLEIDLAAARPVLTINFSFGFDDFYIVKRDIDINRLRLQNDEVQAVRWASRADVLALLKTNQFVPYQASFINLLFDMASQPGSVIRQVDAIY